MNKAKELWFNFKELIAVIVWNIRVFFYKQKHNVMKFLNDLWKKITKNQTAKKEIKNQEKEKIIRNYLKAPDNIDIYFDINIDAEKHNLSEKIKTLSKDKNADKKELECLKEVYKAFPLTRKQKQKRDKVYKVIKGWIKGFLYLSPALILLAIFTFYPILNSFRLAFAESYDAVTNTTSGFSLFGNFLHVLKDESFIIPASHTKSSAVINTMLIVVVSVPVSVTISLLIAVALNSIKPLKSVFQTIFFLPYVTNALALGLVFSYIFREDGGLFNKFLSVFGINGGAWVSAGSTYFKAMFVLLLFTVWNGLAFKIMVFLSAVQGIDKQYYQAAQIDSTPRAKQFWRITVPLISPTILYIVITSVIGSFKTYSSVLAIFGQEGRPTGANFTVKTIVFYIYDFFQNQNQFPIAAAASIILFLLILVMTLIQMQVSKRRVHY